MYQNMYQVSIWVIFQLIQFHPTNRRSKKKITAPKFWRTVQVLLMWFHPPGVAGSDWSDPRWTPRGNSSLMQAMQTCFTVLLKWMESSQFHFLNVDIVPNDDDRNHFHSPSFLKRNLLNKHLGTIGKLHIKNKKNIWKTHLPIPPNSSSSFFSFFFLSFSFARIRRYDRDPLEMSGILHGTT